MRECKFEWSMKNALNFLLQLFYKKLLPIQLTFSKIILEKLHNCRDVRLFLAKSEYLNPYIAPF